MITAPQAITSRHYPTELWSVTAKADQKQLVLKQVANNTSSIWQNEEATRTGIDQIRQLQEQLGFSSGTKRFVFLLYADLLTVQAQHALLKLLEEPPSNTQIVLVSSKPQALLATIRSRCHERQIIAVAKQQDQKSAENYANWQQLSISNAIKTAENYKKRDETLPVVEALVRFLRNEVLPQDTNLPTLQTTLANIDYCLVALDQLANNTNTRLVMEGLFFRLSRHNAS
ncbi:MAG: hypothetical protein GW946_03650 [Candidatus Pacebacteria bacterium]|nr:hypothetical protein [Candidatus Paceibacterota bacterium]PIR60061.1 MAG: hypothetical protein COU67_03935 [Candidatus Pacebacteria bacterium CG10_big_fil_rev_8_21_14_0_10_44_54]